MGVEPTVSAYGGGKYLFSADVEGSEPIHLSERRLEVTAADVCRRALFVLRF